MIGLVAVPKGEQVPSNVDESAAAEHDDGVQWKNQHKEEITVIGILQELLTCAVAEHQVGECTKPQQEGCHCLIQDLVDSSHIYLLIIDSLWR